MTILKAMKLKGFSLQNVQDFVPASGHLTSPFLRPLSEVHSDQEMWKPMQGKKQVFKAGDYKNYNCKPLMRAHSVLVLWGLGGITCFLEFNLIMTL